MPQGYLKKKGNKLEYAIRAGGSLSRFKLGKGSLAWERKLRKEADKLSSGIYRFKTTNIGGGKVVVDLNTRAVNKNKLIKDLEKKTKSKGAKTGMPGIKGYQKAADASSAASSNRAKENRQLIQWLNEARSQASIEAQKRGLKHVGYGKYADPSTGQVVAVSKQGKLHALKKKDRKSVTKKGKKKEKKVDTGQKKDLGIKEKVIRGKQARKAWENYTYGGTEAYGTSKKARMLVKVNKKNDDIQTKTLVNKLPERDKEKLEMSATEWVGGGLFPHKGEGKVHYKRLANFIKKTNPKTTTTTEGVYRGMTIKNAHIDDFIRSFAPGKTVSLPMGSWTHASGQARVYGSTSFEAATKYASVEIQLLPKGGKVSGLSIDALVPGQAGQLEVLNTPDTKYKVVNTKRTVLDFGKGKSTSIYQIQLQEI